MFAILISAATPPKPESVTSVSSGKGEGLPVVVKDDVKESPTTAVVKALGGPKKKGRGKMGSKAESRITRARLFNATGMPQPMKEPTNNAVYRFTHVSEALGALTTSTTVPSTYSQYFALSQFNDVSSLTAIFDQYMIEAVEIWLIPRNSIVSGNTANTGVMHTVVDYDDANTLASVGAAANYANVMVGSGVEGHYRRFVPHVAAAVYSGAFTSFSNVGRRWIDAASTTVQHYGFKAICTVTDSIYTWDAVWRVHFAFRNVY